MSTADEPRPVEGIVGQHDTDWTEFPVCPHCGTQDHDWWDGLPQKNDGDNWDATCMSCGSDYSVVMSVSVHFSTKVPNV
ncbi:MAG: hypothetical protein A3K04_02380 [Gallionellales bacterium RBG_16_56_9]|nr:MAG: hypothetical protein A3K04_02380 [Gallionellales bacterium RBG_16_56_9]